MKALVAGVLALVLLAGAGASARQSDPDLDALMEQYQWAWNKGDAKSLASLYGQNAIRMQTTGAPLMGKAAVEEFFVQAFAGPMKGTRLSLKAGRTQRVNADVRIQEGTYEVTGGTGAPQRGRFLNTVVREGGQWKLASVAPVPDTPPVK
ncbi:MAG: SgcJ/EcaC family oxidoreductase [Acidobacteria bacterium]|nr:SgcJ/EcaC family oxidoreductase [Acidobacteriota bacterium]